MYTINQKISIKKILFILCIIHKNFTSNKIETNFSLKTYLISSAIIGIFGIWYINHRMNTKLETEKKNNTESKKIRKQAFVLTKKISGTDDESEGERITKYNNEKTSIVNSIQQTRDHLKKNPINNFFPCSLI